MATDLSKMFINVDGAIESEVLRYIDDELDRKYWELKHSYIYTNKDIEKKVGYEPDKGKRYVYMTEDEYNDMFWSS
jgi:hypothetical protein